MVNKAAMTAGHYWTTSEATRYLTRFDECIGVTVCVVAVRV